MNRSKSLYMKMLREICVNNDFSRQSLFKSGVYKFLRTTFKNNSITADKLCMSPHEMAIVGSTFVAYSKARKDWLRQIDLYKGRELSPEEAANKCGLTTYSREKP